MDLLERARALAACPLFAELAPAVLIRLAERARVTELAAGERRSTADRMVWVVVDGALAIAARSAISGDPTASVVRRHGGTATPGHVLGLVRVIAPETPMVEAIAERPSCVIGLAVDDMRDVLEEDPLALAAVAAALARALLEAAP